MNYKTVATHSGNFHLDELVAISILKRYNPHIEIVRTRDEKIFLQSDARVDVGEKYNLDTNDFDHHQKGGAGKRENGVEYASAGLVWKHFGRELCNSDEAFNLVDKNLIQYVDSGDNGIENHDEYGLQRIVGKIKSRQEIGENLEDCFYKALSLSGFILDNEIISSNGQVKINEKVREQLKNFDGLPYIILDESLGWEPVLVEESDKLFVIYFENEKYRAKCIPSKLGTFDYKKKFPEEWRGAKQEDLFNETGISDLLFCHNSGFTIATKSLESAVKAIELTLRK